MPVKVLTLYEHACVDLQKPNWGTLSAVTMLIVNMYDHTRECPSSAERLKVCHARQQQWKRNLTPSLPHTARPDINMMIDVWICPWQTATSRTGSPVDMEPPLNLSRLCEMHVLGCWAP